MHNSGVTVTVKTREVIHLLQVTYIMHTSYIPIQLKDMRTPQRLKIIYAARAHDYTNRCK